MRPGAFSINQTFEALSDIVGRSNHVSLCHLTQTGASFKSILGNIITAMRASGTGINHITGDVHYVALGINVGHIVLTIHDCVILDRTSKWNPKFYLYLWFWYKLPIWKADKVTTISEKTKFEIAAFTGCSADKIVVIPNFVNKIYRYHPKEFNKTCPRILHIGVFPNKNLERVIPALEGIPCILEIIGELEERHFNLLRRYGIDFESRANLLLSEMAERYIQADMLVFASTYEGFGLPVVEAQSTGRPVVTSNIAPLNGVAGDKGACFVNPYDIKAIREGILKVIHDDGFRTRLVSNGLENIKRFTLEQVAKEYQQLYQSLSVRQCVV
mgnify:FL=1